MQLDTGALLSLMAETTFKELWPQRSLSSSQVRLCSYSGEAIHVLGAMLFTRVNLIRFSQGFWPYINGTQLATAVQARLARSFPFAE